MPRYIEQLNECTDPATGDYLWVVDSSAGATDKDRKLALSSLAKVPTPGLTNGAVGITLAADEERPLTDWFAEAGSVNYGLLIVTQTSGPATGVFLINSNTVVKIAESAVAFNLTKVSSNSRINIVPGYPTTIHNGFTASRTIRLFFIAESL